MPRIFVCGRRILRLYKSMLKSGQRGLCSSRAIDHKKQEDKRRAKDAPASRLRADSENVSLRASGDGPKRCVCAEIRQAPGRCGNGACVR